MQLWTPTDLKVALNAPLGYYAGMTPIEMDHAKGLNGAIAGELRAERSRKRITFDELHEHTDISRRTLIRLLNGERAINMASLESICRALEVSPSEVIANAQEQLAKERDAMSQEGYTLAASDEDFEEDMLARQEEP